MRTVALSRKRTASPVVQLRRTKPNGSADTTNSNGHRNFDWDRLPRALRQHGHFVLYRNERDRKVPYCPNNPARCAKSNDPATWATFAGTKKAYQTYPSFDGILAVCCPKFTFVDLDDCVEDGRPSARAQEIMRRLPKTYWEYSPSGSGLHGIFRSQDEIANIGKSGSDGLELYSGKHFMSCTGSVLNGTATIARLSNADVEEFRIRKTSSPTPRAADGPILEGRRTNTLLALAGRLRRDGLSVDSIERELRTLNAERCSPPLDENGLTSILKSAAKWKTAGDLLLQEKKDVGNADRLIQWGNGNFGYIAAYRRWAVYNGVRWPVEDREQELIRKEAHSMVRAFIVQAVDAEDKKAIKFATGCLNSPTITKMLREAQPYATLRIRELDSSPLLVNFRNGTLDARAQKLREHRREDLITATIPHDFKPDAKCPKWERFITETFAGDPDVIAFVQRALGYSLTGETSEKCIFLAHGPTDTAKTTLLATIKTLLSDYAGRIKVESLMVERGRPMDANAQSDLADLRGKRFVMTSETGQGQRLREELVKLLSQGQSDYRAVRKYENPFDFQQTWKIWIDCNHLPVVHGTDAAIWQRLVVIPFHHVVEKSKQNAALSQQLIAEEAEGILAWLIQGLRQWQEMGLSPPETVLNQRQEWQEESDDLALWLTACCVQRPNAKAPSRLLYDSYKLWRKDAGLFEENIVLFARKMKDHGFTKREEGANKVPTWHGVEVKEVPKWHGVELKEK